MVRALIYGVVFHGKNTIDFIGATRGKLDKLKNTWRYGELPAPDGEKYRLVKKIRDVGIWSFSIRILSILEDVTDEGMFAERDRFIMEHQPELNVFTVLSREDANRIAVRRDRRRRALEGKTLKGNTLFSYKETIQNAPPLGVSRRSSSVPPPTRRLYRISETHFDVKND